MNRSSIALFLATAGLAAGVAGCSQSEAPKPSSPAMEKPAMGSPGAEPSSKPEKPGNHDGMKHEEGGEGGEGGEG
ncbi:MAG: hypothetical protein QUV06_00595 [Cyanobium sp. CZS 48M]|nr:hypothetical protein [Cyanobium sp. CZS48M]